MKISYYLFDRILYLAGTIRFASNIFNKIATAQETIKTLKGPTNHVRLPCFSKVAWLEALNLLERTQSKVFFGECSNMLRTCKICNFIKTFCKKPHPRIHKNDIIQLFIALGYLIYLYLNQDRCFKVFKGQRFLKLGNNIILKALQ